MANKLLSKILILSFISLGNNYNVYSQNNMIYWKENTKLKWKDFQGKVKNDSKHFAISSTGAFFEFRLESMADSAKIIFETYAIFNKDSSWSKSWGRSPYLLKHEQTHFNITELYTRKLRKALSEYVFSESYQLEIQRIIRYFNNERNKKQSQYDAETKHSLNETAQRKWNKYIASELKRFEAFTSPVVENMIP